MQIAAYVAALLTNDQRHLGVGLESEKPVGYMHTLLLQHAGPANVAFFIGIAPSTQPARPPACHSCRARSRAATTGELEPTRYKVIFMASTSGSAAAASRKSTTGENESYGWCSKWCSPARAGKQIPFPHSLLERGRRKRYEGSIQQFRAFYAARDAHEPVETQRTVNHVHVVVIHFHILDQELSHALGHITIDLQPDDGPEAPTPHALAPWSQANHPPPAPGWPCRRFG